MEPKAYRAFSVQALESEGLRVPDHLPLINMTALRGPKAIVERLLCLHACAAASYGFPKMKALAWAKQENVDQSFEQEELRFLKGQDAGALFRFQIEGMAALHWALGHEDEIDWFSRIDDKFVTRLPGLRRSEHTSSMQSSSRLRTYDEIAAAADLAYCLHWVTVDAKLRGLPIKLPLEDFVPAERRRAFDWLIGSEPWYSIILNT